MEVVEVEGKYRRLFFLILVSLSAWLLAGCTPAASLDLEPCPVPVNLPLEDEPTVALLLPGPVVSEADAAITPEAIVTEVTVTEPPVAPLPEKPVSATPKAVVMSPVTVAEAPIVSTPEEAPIKVAAAVVTGPPPVIVSHTPINNSEVEWAQDIRILFSGPMDRAATEQAISVIPEIEYSVSWYRDDKLIRLVPSVMLIEYQRYEVVIDADAAAAGGALLGADFSFGFWGEEP